MNDVSSSANATAVAAKKKLSSKFFKKGVTVAILSGMCYGLYTAFITLGMSKRSMGRLVWREHCRFVGILSLHT